MWHEVAAVGVAYTPTLLALDHPLVQIPADLVLAEATLVMSSSPLYQLKLVRVSKVLFKFCSQFTLHRHKEQCSIAQLL